MAFRLGVALLLGALVLVPVPVSAQESGASLEQLIVEMADKPSDHAALAKYYRAKAEAARAAAKTHETMARSYSGGKIVQRQQMESHCKKLSEQNSAMAAEYEALAKLHEAESK